MNSDEWTYPQVSSLFEVAPGVEFEIGTQIFIPKKDLIPGAAKAPGLLVRETEDKLTQAVWKYIGKHDLEVTLTPYIQSSSRTSCYDHSYRQWSVMPDEEQGLEMNCIAAVKKPLQETSIKH